MKRLKFTVVIMAMIVAGCASVKVENISRSIHPIGKIEALAIQIESGSLSVKRAKDFEKIIANELQKMGERHLPC
ncbi:MAG: hypothetical protein IVZ94_06605 [Nitrospirae bacterium]|nr:hypothetical protein [Nitrospirota bacterium]